MVPLWWWKWWQEQKADQPEPAPSDGVFRWFTVSEILNRCPWPH